jgi:hypothetical protein
MCKTLPNKKPIIIDTMIDEMRTNARDFASEDGTVSNNMHSKNEPMTMTKTASIAYFTRMSHGFFIFYLLKD